MADRLTITVEANDQASTVIESLKKKLDELSKQTESAGARSQDFDKQIKTVAASIETLGAKISSFSNDLVAAGQTITQTGRDIGKTLGTEILSSTTGSLSQLSSLMQSWGANAARSFAQGLRTGSSDVSSAAYDISDILPDTFRFILQQGMDRCLLRIPRTGQQDWQSFCLKDCCLEKTSLKAVFLRLVRYLPNLMFQPSLGLAAWSQKSRDCLAAQTSHQSF